MELSHTAKNICLVIDNTYDLYCIKEWLVSALVKKLKRGIDVDFKRLADSSTIRKIVNDAAKLIIKDGGVMPTREDKQQAREYLADCCIERAQDNIELD